MMTDEKRAWAIAEDLGPCDSERIFWRDRLLEWATAIRADQREIDAGIAEAEMCETSPTHELDMGYDMACQHIAAAIRKGGET